MPARIGEPLQLLANFQASQLLGPFPPSDAGGELRTEQSSVGGLVRKPSYRGESSLYSDGGKLSALEENAIFRIGTIEQLNRQFRQTSRPKG